MMTNGTGTVMRPQRTVASQVPSCSTEVYTNLDGISIVFVVEDDVSVRESLELLIESTVGGQSYLRQRRSFCRAPGPLSPAV